VNLMSVVLVAPVLKPENADCLIDGFAEVETYSRIDRRQYDPQTLIPPDRVTR
jgi:hypothetical protein